MSEDEFYITSGVSEFLPSNYPYVSIAFSTEVRFLNHIKCSIFGREYVMNLLDCKGLD